MKRRAFAQLAACLPVLLALPKAAEAVPAAPPELSGELFFGPGHTFVVRPAGPDGMFVKVLNGPLKGTVLTLDHLMQYAQTCGGTIRFRPGQYRRFNLPKGHAAIVSAPEPVGRFPRSF